MSLEKIPDLLKKNESNSIFFHEKIWKDMAPMHDKYRAYLSPDSNIYHSVINPIFSFELEADNFKSFRIFSMLSLRDGIYPLLRFFAINPVPHEIDPVLVIDSKLASAVPSAWRDRVVLRELFVKPKMIEVNSKELLLLISPDKDALPLDVFEKDLDGLQSEIDSFESISVYLSSCNSFGEEDAEFDSSWGYKLLRSIFNKFPDKKISILDYNEYQKKNVSEVTFHFLNSLQFYFSDSYLLHDLLQRGAIPLEVQSQKTSMSVDISINHGFNFHQNFETNEIVLDSVLREKVFKGIIFQPAMSGDFTNLKLSTKEFKNWASASALGLFKLLP